MAWEYFTRTLKYSNTHAAAIIGNLLVASGPGWVLEGSRGEDLQIYSQERKRRISDIFLQLQFIDWELSNRPVFKGGEFFKIKSLPQATVFFQQAYMQPTFVNRNGVAIPEGNIPKWTILKDDGTREYPTVEDIKEVDLQLGTNIDTQQKSLAKLKQAIGPLQISQFRNGLAGNLAAAEQDKKSIQDTNAQIKILEERIDQNIKLATSRFFFNLTTFVLVPTAPAPSISEFALKSGVLGIPDFKTLDEEKAIINAKKIFNNFSRNSSGGNV